MGGRDHADLDPNDLCSTQSPKFLVLKNLEELRLQPDIHVPDLIQENGSPIGQLKDAWLFLGAPVKAPCS